jgi:hypothetical protein
MSTKGSKRTAGKKTGTGPRRGDVLSVGYADPEKAARHQAGMADALKQRVPPGPLCPVPDDDERVAVRLDDYPYTFVVRVRAGRTGPVVTHLEVTADDGTEVDYNTLRSIPLRRIALSAHNWLRRFGGTVGFPGDNELRRTRPGDRDADRLHTLVALIESAILSGLPVRETVATEMGLGTATIDRLIRKAKDAGLMDGIEIPKRPGTRQRDRALADHLIGIHLDTHGPYSDAPMSPELTDVLARIAEREGTTETTNDTTTTTASTTGKDDDR